LVIIGYSFPFFNREIDREIMGEINFEKLKKIYFQDPFRDGEFLRGQFNIPDNVEIKNIKEPDQFHIPFEM